MIKLNFWKCVYQIKPIPVLSTSFDLICTLYNILMLYSLAVLNPIVQTDSTEQAI